MTEVEEFRRYSRGRPCSPKWPWMEGQGRARKGPTDPPPDPPLPDRFTVPARPPARPSDRRIDCPTTLATAPPRPPPDRQLPRTLTRPDPGAAPRCRARRPARRRGHAAGRAALQLRPWTRAVPGAGAGGGQTSRSGRTKGGQRAERLMSGRSGEPGPGLRSCEELSILWARVPERASCAHCGPGDGPYCPSPVWVGVCRGARAAAWVRGCFAAFSPGSHPHIFEHCRAKIHAFGT